VSVGFDLLSLLLSDGHLYSNPLGLAVRDNFHVVLVLGRCHGNPLGLGVLGLGGDDLGVSGGGVQRSASTAAPQTCPWSCSVMIVVQMLRIVNLLELGTCNHLVSILLLVFPKTIGDSVLDDVGPRVDSQLGHGVLLPVLTAFTLLSYSTVSTSMFLKRLMVGADLGDFGLEIVGGHDLEGLIVGGKDGLGSLLNLGLLGGLHVNVVLGVLGASEGSGTSFLLLHVNLLGLGSHHIHLHGNPLGLGAVVLETEGDSAGVGECRRQRSASDCLAPRIWHLQPPCQSSSQRRS
jgi:hypothetical protein